MHANVQYPTTDVSLSLIKCIALVWQCVAPLPEIEVVMPLFPSSSRHFGLHKGIHINVTSTIQNTSCSFHGHKPLFFNPRQMRKLNSVILFRQFWFIYPSNRCSAEITNTIKFDYILSYSTESNGEFVFESEKQIYFHPGWSHIDLYHWHISRYFLFALFKHSLINSVRNIGLLYLVFINKITFQVNKPLFIILFRVLLVLKIGCE